MQIMIERFGRDSLVLGEFVPSPDGKLRYFRHVREEMYREIAGLIRKYWGEFPGEETTPPIDLAMEPKYIWRNVGMGEG